jgi:hypothetical protein
MAIGAAPGGRIKVHLTGLDQLDSVLDQFLAFGQTTTSIVQSTPVAPRGLPLPDGGVRLIVQGSRWLPKAAGAM